METGTVSVRTYFPHEPVGSRCSHQLADSRPAKGNDWNFTVPGFRAEMEKLHENDLDPALTFAEHQDYQAKVKTLVHRAQQGTISFDGGDEAKRIRNILVELKPKLEASRPAFGRKPRLLRLYLAEPRLHAYLLVALHLATKEASEAGLDEQDEAINTAVDRAYSWDGSLT
jgi:hypothetical protein